MVFFGAPASPLSIELVDDSSSEALFFPRRFFREGSNKIKPSSKQFDKFTGGEGTAFFCETTGLPAPWSPHPYSTRAGAEPPPRPEEDAWPFGTF